MEKRLLVTIFLSFLVLYAYQVFVLQPAADKKRQAAAVNASREYIHDYANSRQRHWSPRHLVPRNADC